MIEFLNCVGSKDSVTEYFLRKREDKKIQIKKYSKTLTPRNLSVRRIMHDACLIQVPVNRSVIEG